MAALVDFKAPHQSRKRHHESESEDFESDDEIESEEEIGETPEEKRLRLAQIYLEELQRKGNHFRLLTYNVYIIFCNLRILTIHMYF